MRNLAKFLFIFSFCMALSSGAKADSIVDYYITYVGDFSEGKAVVAKWTTEFEFGYINDKAELIIDMTFVDAHPFKNGIAAVGIRDANGVIKYGYINEKGDFIIKPKFDHAAQFFNIPGTERLVAKVAIGKNHSTLKYGLVNTDGTYHIEPLYKQISDYNPSYREPSEYIVAGIYNNSGEEKYALIDKDGTTLIEPSYDWIYAEVSNTDLGYAVIVQGKYPNRKYGLYDIQKNILIKPEYQHIMINSPAVQLPFFKDGIKKYKIYSREESSMKSVYDDILYWTDDIWLILKDGKYGLVSRTDGSLILDPIYDKLSMQTSGIAVASKDGKNLYISDRGEKLNGPTFSLVTQFQNYSDLVIAEKNGKKGVYSKSESKFIIEPKYDKIELRSGGYCKVELAGKFGIINTYGETLLDVEYDDIGYPNLIHDISTATFSGNTVSYKHKWDNTKPKYIAAKRNGKKYFFNSDYSALNLPADNAMGDFDELYSFENGYARVLKDNKQGYVNENFQYIVKPEWDQSYRDSRSNTLDQEEVLFESYIIIKDKKMGAAFTDGTIIEPISEIPIKETQGIALVRIDKKYRFMTKDGKFISDDYYANADTFSEGKAVVYKLNMEGIAEYFFIDKKGNQIGETYSSARRYSEGLAYVYRRDIGGVYIDHRGNIVVGKNLKLKSGFPFKDGRAPAGIWDRKNKKVKYGLIDKEGAWIIKPTFDEVKSFDRPGYSSPRYHFYKNNKHAVISPDGKIIWD